MFFRLDDFLITKGFVIKYYFLKGFWPTIFGRVLSLGDVFGGVCCFDAVLPMFFIHFCGSSPEKHQRKFSLCQVFVFFASRSLGLRFFGVVVVRALSVCSSSTPSSSVFLREKDQVVTGHTHTPPLHVSGPGSFSVAVLSLGRCVVFVPTLFAARPSSSGGLSGVCVFASVRLLGFSRDSCPVAFSGL